MTRTLPPAASRELTAAIDRTIPRHEREGGPAWLAFMYWIRQTPPRTWGGVARALGKGKGYVTQVKRLADQHGWIERGEAIDALLMQAADGTTPPLEPDPLPEPTSPPELPRVKKERAAAPPKPAREPKAPKPAREPRERVRREKTSPPAVHVTYNLAPTIDRDDILFRYREATRNLNMWQLAMSERLTEKLLQAVEALNVEKLKPSELAALIRAAAASSTAAIDQLSELEGVKEFIEERTRRAEELAAAKTSTRRPAAQDADIE